MRSRLIVLVWIGLYSLSLCAQDNTIQKASDKVGPINQREYSLEAGLQAGVGYYLGDANKIPFVGAREVLGAQIRYKFNQRWAVQCKVQRQTLSFLYASKPADGLTLPKTDIYANPMWNVDFVGDFNFFRFGPMSFDSRVKRFTPYVFVGVGMTLDNKAVQPSTKNMDFPTLDFKKMNISVYIPVGLGLKWRFAERWQVQLAWQHNIYLLDNVEGYLKGVDFGLEGMEENVHELKNGVLNNSHDMNGFNIFNNDVTSSLTIGVVYEFGSHMYKRYVNEKVAVSARIKRSVHYE